MHGEDRERIIRAGSGSGIIAGIGSGGSHAAGGSDRIGGAGSSHRGSGSDSPTATGAEAGTLSPGRRGRGAVKGITPDHLTARETLQTAKERTETGQAVRERVEAPGTEKFNHGHLNAKFGIIGCGG